MSRDKADISVGTPFGVSANEYIKIADITMAHFV
jgi:hypothetical protein